MKKKQVRESKEDVIFDVVNTVLITALLIIVLYPLIFIVSASFSGSMEVLKGEVILFPKNITLEAYRRVFMDENIVSGYINTIIYTVIGTAISLFFTFTAAYPLSRKDFKGRNIIMIYLSITMFFGGGLIPTYLVVKSLHMIDTIWSIVLLGSVSVWNIIVTRTFFQGIPFELQEAAFIDGCSNTRTFISVIMPLSSTIVAVMVLFYGVYYWNNYFSALIYLNDEAKYPLQLVLRKIMILGQMDNMVNSGTESVASQQMAAETIKYSVIVVASVPVLIIYPFLQKYFEKGVMVGAIKG